MIQKQQSTSVCNERTYEDHLAAKRICGDLQIEKVIPLDLPVEVDQRSLVSESIAAERWLVLEQRPAADLLVDLKKIRISSRVS